MRALKKAPSERRGNPQTGRQTTREFAKRQLGWRTLGVTRGALVSSSSYRPRWSCHGRSTDICAAWYAAMSLAKAAAKPRKIVQKISD